MERRAQLAQVQQPIRKKQKTNANPSEAPNASTGPHNGEDAAQNNDNQVQARPVGRKAMKEKSRQHGSSDVVGQLEKIEANKAERYNHFLGMEKERLELENYKFEHQKRIIKMDISGMPVCSKNSTKCGRKTLLLNIAVPRRISILYLYPAKHHVVRWSS